MFFWLYIWQNSFKVLCISPAFLCNERSEFKLFWFISSCNFQSRYRCSICTRESICFKTDMKEWCHLRSSICLVIKLCYLLKCCKVGFSHDYHLKIKSRGKLLYAHFPPVSTFRCWSLLERHTVVSKVVSIIISEYVIWNCVVALSALLEEI